MLESQNNNWQKNFFAVSGAKFCVIEPLFFCLMIQVCLIIGMRRNRIAICQGGWFRHPCKIIYLAIRWYDWMQTI